MAVLKVEKFRKKKSEKHKYLTTEWFCTRRFLRHEVSFFRWGGDREASEVCVFRYDSIVIVNSGTTGKKYK